MKKLAIFYARVSTDEQAEKGYSLPHQATECRRYAVLNGFSIVEEFFDDYSGATLDRPGFTKLRQYLSQNRVDAVIVYTADRLSRNIIDFLVIRDQWEKAGIELHYVDRGRSQNNFEGLLTDGIFALMAHGERLQIIERTSNGRHNKALANKIVMTGIPPYGYQRRGQGKDAEYVIDPHESEIVRNIFEWYVNGYGNKGPLGTRTIANLLDDMGITPPRYRKKKIANEWQAHTVWIILNNPIYTGITYYGRQKTVNGKRVLRPKEEWKPITVPHLAIIDKEIFDLAQQQFQRNKELSQRNKKWQYLMTGHFRCGSCGKVMFGHYKPFPNGTKKPYYKCSTRQKRGVCNTLKKQISAVRVDTAVWEWVVGLLEDETNLDKGIRAMMEKRANAMGPMKDRLATIESLLEAANSKIERLVDELSEYQGMAVRDVIREKIISIEGERNMLLDEFDRISKELERNDIVPDYEQQIKRTAAKIRKGLSGVSIEHKQMVLEALQLQVQYFFDPDRGEILQISCVIPFLEGQIALPPSPRWLRSPCRCSTASPPKNLC